LGCASGGGGYGSWEGVRAVDEDTDSEEAWCLEFAALFAFLQRITTQVTTKQSKNTTVAPPAKPIIFAS